VNSTRLYVLGALARYGPMHGHQIRRVAQVDRVEFWADVKPGSLYGALHRMAAEGIVEVVRTEQAGNLPARTVYGITEIGRIELRAHRDEALRDTRVPTDPVDVALGFSDELDAEEMAAAIENRRLALAAQLATLHQLRDQAGPYLTGIEPMIVQHRIGRLRYEIEWHDALLADLPKLLAAPPRAPGHTPATQETHDD
jgi:DNA-binding PadR family transcriptional regulator